MTGRPAGKLALDSTGEILVSQLFVADTFWSRLCGLQFRRGLPPGTGLLLKPCGGVHTFWMRFPIDVLFLGDDGTVLDIQAGLRPWRMATPAASGVVSVLEVSAGQGFVKIGERLVQLDSSGALQLFSTARPAVNGA